MIELFKPLAHDNIPEIDLVMQIWKAELKERLQIVIQKLFPGAIVFGHSTPNLSAKWILAHRKFSECSRRVFG